METILTKTWKWTITIPKKYLNDFEENSFRIVKNRRGIKLER